MSNQCSRCGKSYATEMLDPETGLLYCFNCGQAYYPEEPVLFINGKGPDAKQIARCKEICAAACHFYQNRLYCPDGARVRAYLQTRKISKESVAKFGLGYAPDTDSALLNHLLTLGYSQKDAVNSGLAASENDVIAADHLRNRLVVPLHNAIGEIVAFSGRKPSDASKAIKYLNTHSSPIYRRNNLLFNQHIAAESGCSYWILVEGYFDVISLDSYGFHNAVSTMGTALTEYQVKLIAGSVREVVVLYDGDGPGAEAMYSAVEKLSIAGLVVSSLILPGKHDPDSYLRKNGRNRLVWELGNARKSIALPRSEYAKLPDRDFLLDLCLKLQA